jgi:hypothetical protein
MLIYGDFGPVLLVIEFVLENKVLHVVLKIYKDKKLFCSASGCKFLYFFGKLYYLSPNTQQIMIGNLPR